MNKKNMLNIVLAFFLIVLFNFSAWAVPGLINYQGKVTDKDYNPLDGKYYMSFRLYTSESGPSFMAWSEEQAVLVFAGVYNVQLGSVTPLTEEDFIGDQRYLEVAIDNDGVWEILSPRQRLTSAAFSMKAGDADTLDGEDATFFAEATHRHYFSEIDGTASDAQIPNNITIEYAATATTANSAGYATDAGDAETLDGLDSAAFALSAHTHSFADIIGTATDTQIPNDITVNYAANAGNADTVDGQHASAFALSTHNHDNRYYTKSEVDSLIAGLQSRIVQLETLLEHFSCSDNQIYITGANLHIRNGTGSTDGAVNHLGNLIVGYNESRGSADDRSGSHNIIVGTHHNFSSYGGICVGKQGTISGTYASVIGGNDNKAIGPYSSVIGGWANECSGDTSTILGGDHNQAMNIFSTVAGGYDNKAIGTTSMVSGGASNVASGTYSISSGGSNNNTTGICSSVSGGRYNKASGMYASVVGGGGEVDAYGNEAFAAYSAILGGTINVAGDRDLADHAIGKYSTVSGGYNNATGGDYSSVSGGKFNDSNGSSSSISGGLGNKTTGYYASISGGLYNDATAQGSSVSGGYDNAATAYYSTVSGGNSNFATGDSSTVSGGWSRRVSGDYDWRAGKYFSEE